MPNNELVPSSDQVAALPLPSDSLEAYLRAINHFPILSEEEERQFAFKLIEENDLESAQRLILSHLRFVVHIARGYSGYGLPLGDLIQEGNIGLMKAVKRFDPTLNVRLVSFAVHWIKAEIHEFILRNWRLVKIATTKPQRKLFFKLRSSKSRLGWFTQEEVERVAKDLGVSPDTVREMESRLSGHDLGFDGQSDDNDDAPLAPSAYIQAPEADPATRYEAWDQANSQHEQLQVALEGLDERSRDIVTQRWLSEEKSTLQQLADRYNVSAERIRQLEKGALKKLRNYMEA